MLLQTTHQIPSHSLDHLMLTIKELRNRFQQRLQAHALPHQLDIRKANLPRPPSRHGSALLARRCPDPHPLRSPDIARASLHQQVLKRTPVLHRAAHLGHQDFGNVNCKPPSVVPAIKNMAPMLLAGQTNRAVLAPARTAAEAQWPRIAGHKSAASLSSQRTKYLLMKVKLARGSTEANAGICEDFRTSPCHERLGRC
jgi:hypothetical protein